MLTHPALQNLPIAVLAEFIAMKTFEFILGNLNQHGCRTSRLRFHDLYWLVPRPKVNQQQLSIFLIVRANLKKDNAINLMRPSIDSREDCNWVTWLWRRWWHTFLTMPQIDSGFPRYFCGSLNQVILGFMDIIRHITIHLADEARKRLDHDQLPTCIFAYLCRKVGNDLSSEWKRLHHCPKSRDLPRAKAIKQALRTTRTTRTARMMRMTRTTRTKNSSSLDLW